MLLIILFLTCKVLPDSLCKNVGIGAKLLPGDKIGAFAFNPQSMCVIT